MKYFLVIFAFLGGWILKKISEKFLDKTLGSHVDLAVDIVVDEWLVPAFNAMKAYLANNTLKEVESKAQKGDSEAQFNMGTMFYFGAGVNQG